MNIFERLGIGKKSNPITPSNSAETPSTPAPTVAEPETIVPTPEAAPASSVAAVEISRAANQLAQITASEAVSTGSMDIPAPTANPTMPTVTEQFAGMAATGAPGPVESVPTADYQVPDVTAMSDAAIHEALKIPAIPAPTEAPVAAPNETAPVETKDQGQL